MKITVRSRQWEFDTFDAVVAAICSLIAIPIVTFFTESFFIASLLSGFFGGVMSILRRKYINALIHRAEASETVAWDVELNGVFVGKINDNEFAELRLTIFTDPFAYFSQIINIGRVAMGFFGQILINFPIWFFWGLVALAIYDPETIVKAWQAFQTFDQTQMVNFSKNIAHTLPVLAMILFFIWLPVCLNLGPVPGFRNQFAEMTTTKLRQKFGVCANGDIQMFRCDTKTNKYIQNDELRSTLISK